MQLQHPPAEIVSRADARARGLTRYFTGHPCSHGHVAERVTANGVCVACKTGIQSRSRKRRRSLITARDRAYRAQNAARTRTVKQAWHARNSKKRRRQNAEWHRRNPAKAAARCAAWALAAKRPDRQKVYRARRRARKLEARLGCRRSYRAFVLFVRTAARIRCYWCARPVAKAQRRIDHIIPLAKGGADAVENLCVACVRCNTSKGAKLPYEFSGQAEIAF